MEIELDTPFVHFLLQDGLLTATYKKGLLVNLAMAKQVVQSRLSFTGSGPLPVLILTDGEIKMDKEARDYLASPEGTEGLSAAAMVLNTTYDWTIGILFLCFQKPAMPTRVFTRRAPAIKWLRKFVKD